MNANTIKTSSTFSPLVQTTLLWFPASASDCPCCTSLPLLFLPKSGPLTLPLVTLRVACLLVSPPVRCGLKLCCSFNGGRSVLMCNFFLLGRQAFNDAMPADLFCTSLTLSDTTWKNCLELLSCLFLMTCLSLATSGLLPVKAWRYKT